MPRAGLVKKIIKDARGHRRTYWVRPGLSQLKRLTQAKEKARVDDHQAREAHLRDGVVAGLKSTGISSMNVTQKGKVTQGGKSTDVIVKTGQGMTRLRGR